MNKKYFMVAFLIICTTTHIKISYGMKEDGASDVPKINPTFKTVKINIEALNKVGKDLNKLNKNFRQFNQINQKKNPTFLERRLQNADQLLSTILINGGFQLFALVVGKAWHSYFDDSTKIEKQLKELENLGAQLEIHKGKLTANNNLLQMYQNKIEHCKSPEKRKRFVENYNRHVLIQRSIKRKMVALQEKFTSSDIDLQELRRKEPKVTFENNNGELVIAAPPEENNSKVEPTNENAASAFFATAEKQTTAA